MKELNHYTGIPTLARVGLVVFATVIGLLLTLAVVVAQGPDLDEDSYKDGPRYAWPGDAITYTIVVVNSGDAPAYNVVLSDTLSDWVEPISGTCTYDDGHQSFPCGPLDNLWDQEIDFWSGTCITTTFAVTLSAGTTCTARLPLINRAYLIWDGHQKEISCTTTLNPVHIYLPLVLRNFPPAWKQGVNTDNARFYTPSCCESDTETWWYAGTPDADVVGVWKSMDNAQHWNGIVTLSPYPYPVVANPNDCNQAFVSVWGSGIYRIAGDSAQAVNDGLGETYVYGLAITGTTLYAGTNSQGVYKTDINDIAWRAVNTGIDEHHIRSLAVIGNRVYAGARACTLYVSDDGGGSWLEQTVLTDGCDDAQVWSIAEVKTVRYAGLGLSKGLYYKAGSGWLNVIPNHTVYGLAYDGTNGYLYVSTYGSGIYRCSIDDTGTVQECHQYNPGLTTLNMREIRIHNGWLVAGSDDGIWYLPLFR